jgi:predicted PurR-regulated permease PerM
MQTERQVERLAGIVGLIFLVIGCYIVIRPFLSAIIWAAILCYSTWPIYRRLLRLSGGRSALAATTLTLCAFFVLVLPFVAVSASLADDVAALADQIRAILNADMPPPPAWLTDLPVIGGKAGDYWRELAKGGGNITSELQRLAVIAKDIVLGAGAILGAGILELLLSLFIAFFLYRHGSALAESLSVAMSRVAGTRAASLIEIAGVTVTGVVYGIVGTALVQGILAAIGLWIAGVAGVAFLGFLTFILSFLPMGPPLVWGPAAIWLLYKGDTAWGIFLLLWGIFVVSGVDNFLRPYLISRGSQLPLVLVFVGAFGGAFGFGFIGLFIGPTLLAVAFTLVREFTAASPEPTDGPNMDGS